MFAGFRPSETDVTTDGDHAAAVENGHFLLDAYLISRVIMDILKEDSVFKNYLSELPDPASFMHGLCMDLPLHIEILLPIRLPIGLAAIFDEEQRTVQLKKLNRDLESPFFLANMLNSKCINILLEQELQRAIASLGYIYSVVNSSVVYNLSYRAHNRCSAPVMHEVLAVQRGTNGRRRLRFDFILAVLFEWPVLPLPRYYNCPTNCTWVAYGTVAVDHNSNPADWNVVVPKWTSRPVTPARQCRRVLLLTHRMLCAQPAHSCAILGSRNGNLAPIIREIDLLGYNRTSTVQLILMIMNTLVEKNIFRPDYPTNVSAAMLQASQQRMRLEGLIRILENLRDATPGEITYGYYRYIYILPAPVRHGRLSVQPIQPNTMAPNLFSHTKYRRNSI
ncbi:uncharacterized protein [Drosophila pseudoobscura]|uniref:GATOR complex protein NPRL2 n=1 Tax=Drosophila pseudoobscura pseudoobscura TaxID=46245 RepID=A0A6I8VJP4_DROPS|nr:uncharacterized protein LOC6900943 [Drosophila pseudoobscura]XP_015042408.2 uncharacterized protein LOC6900943 [Drosophila pseudoobscura]